MREPFIRMVAAGSLVAFVAACGGAHPSASGPAASSAVSTTTPVRAASAPTTTAGSPGALVGEAASAATGDIPDNQVFLTFVNRAAGYSLKYPEGWAERGHGTTVSFSDKNNVIRVVIQQGPKPTLREAAAGLSRGATATVSSAARALTVGGKPSVKVSYRTMSAPNSVTGKRVTLVVDRYYFWHGGKRAIVDLGTAVGVDNVDAYRLISESFRWR